MQHKKSITWDISIQMNNFAILRNNFFFFTEKTSRRRLFKPTSYLNSEHTCQWSTLMQFEVCWPLKTIMNRLIYKVFSPACRNYFTKRFYIIGLVVLFLVKFERSSLFRLNVRAAVVSVGSCVVIAPAFYLIMWEKKMSEFFTPENCQFLYEFSHFVWKNTINFG